MPSYFAYGANLDVEAMRQRCPNSKPVCRARLPRHRFFIMDNGYASVVRDARLDVHGLLWDLAFSDIPALDRFEDVGRGLYAKVTQPVLKEGGGSVRALVYVGRSKGEGKAKPGYFEPLIAAARAQGLPALYIDGLVSLHTGEAPPRRSALNLRPLQ